METLRYVVLANVLLAVVSVAYYALLRRETFFGLNRLILWLSVIGALLLPLLELPDWRPQPVRTVMQRTARAIVPKVLPRILPQQPEVTITFPNKKTYRAFQQTAFHWSWPWCFLMLYIVGVLLLFIRFGAQLTSMQRLIRQSIHEFYDDFTLVNNPSVKSPFSFFAWVVLNPDQHSPNELEQILRHERVHVRQRHSVDMLGAELICIIFWFNPAVYLFRHLLRQTLEFSADQGVLGEGVDAKAYQYSLVKVSMTAQQSMLANQFSGPNLQQRIRVMNRQRSKQVVHLRYPVILLILFSVAFGCQLAVNHSFHQYIQSSGNTLFSVITAKTSDQHLDTLRQELAQRQIEFNITKLVRAANGSIQQIALNLRVPEPGHPIAISVGSSIGEALIQPIGLRCDTDGCQLTLVNSQFPKRLATIASKETLAVSPESIGDDKSSKSANVAYGLYQVFFRNDFLESNYFGLRSTAIRMTSDYHLDLYSEFGQAVIYLDGHEISRRELASIPALDLKKVVVFTGEAAVVRLGNVRARHGLVLLSRLQNISVRDKYAATTLLRAVYPQLFAQP